MWDGEGTRGPNGRRRRTLSEVYHFTQGGSEGYPETSSQWTSLKKHV